MEPKPGEDVARTNRARAVFRAYPQVGGEVRLPDFLADIIYFCQVRDFDFDGAPSDARLLLGEEDEDREKRGPKCSRCDDLLVLQDEAEDGTIIESLCLCHVL